MINMVLEVLQPAQRADEIGQIILDCHSPGGEGHVVRQSTLTRVNIYLHND